MSKRKPMDKAQARERRNRLLETAAAAELSLTEGVREMRAIAGMTQEEFAQHRGVSARAIKTLELGQGNPTVATLNRIGEFFGLEVAFVPLKRAATGHTGTAPASTPEWPTVESLMAGQKALEEYFDTLAAFIKKNGLLGSTTSPTEAKEIPQAQNSKESTPSKTFSIKKNNKRVP